MPEWQHLVIDGPAAVTHGFVAGVLADHGIDVAPHWGEALGLERHSLADRARELLLGDQHEELFLPAAAADVVATALVAGGPTAGLRLAGRQIVHDGSFRWTAHVTSRELHAKIRTRFVDMLAVGLTAGDLVEQEVVDPSAAGVHLYSSAHAYECWTSGRITGSLPALLDLYADARGMDFVRVTPLALTGTTV